MFTIQYKGFYINAYCDRPACSVVDALACSKVRHFKTVRAAKCFITRSMVQAYAAGSYLAA